MPLKNVGCNASDLTKRQARKYIAGVNLRHAASWTQILLIVLLVVRVEIDSITAKSYILQKVYFNEFVQNSLGGNMGMIIFDLRGYGGC